MKIDRVRFPLSEPNGWRIVVFAVVQPIAEALIASLRELEHDVVGWLMPRRPGSRAVDVADGKIWILESEPQS